MDGLNLLSAESPREDALQQHAKMISARVSPWLWILSILGFGFAIQNRYQIQKMYSHWKSLKQSLTKR